MEGSVKKVRDMDERNWNTNDGFGPQPTGNETIADFFDNEGLLILSKKEQKEKVIREGLNKDLLKKLRLFKTKLTRKTPLHKYEILTDWLEAQVVDSVLKKQVSSKRISRLLRSSVYLEEEKGVRGVISFASTVAPTPTKMWER